MKKKETNEVRLVNVLMFDENNIEYYHGVVASIEFTPDTYTVESVDNGISTHIGSWHVHFTSPELRKQNNVVLDDTTMKRIAKFNKIKEINRLDTEIEEKQEKIKVLDALLQDKEKRWNKVKDYIKNIYEINPYEDDDYDDDDDEE